MKSGVLRFLSPRVIIRDAEVRIAEWKKGVVFTEAGEVLYGGSEGLG